MELHTCLWNEVSAFNFRESDLSPILETHPGLTLHFHEDADAFLRQAESAQLVLTWDFPRAWYEHCPSLKLVMTPAAGTDWVEQDPTGQIPVVHGSFHGEILAESLLSALLFMNHRMPDMIRNFQTRHWDRNLQKDSLLLQGQTVLIVGMGNIGVTCARYIRSMGTTVIGVRRDPGKSPPGTETYAIEALPSLLPEADHVVLLLPGNHETDGFMTGELLSFCKPGAFIYNFGRGNVLHTRDLVHHWDRFAGAFLDVTDEEPLPPDSPLWQLDNIMITPHSSCIYDDYRRMFVANVIEELDSRFK